MLGVIITLATVAAIAYFVIKNYYPPIILLIIGLILLLIAGLTGTPPVGAKTSTHFFGFDLAQASTLWRLPVFRFTLTKSGLQKRW